MAAIVQTSVVRQKLDFPNASHAALTNGTSSMKVHILQIPQEGLHIEGEEPSSILELNDEIARPTGPITYSLDVGLSDG